MLPPRLISKINPESWGGILDATYAIVLTLLTIDLPVQILSILDRMVDIAKDPTPQQLAGMRVEVWFAFFNLIIGYFTVFVIIYDIWSYHRIIVGVKGRLHLRAILTSFTMFLGTLIPSLHYVVNSVRQKFIFAGAIEGSAIMFQLNFARALEYPIIALTYFFIFVQAASDLSHLRGAITPADEKDVLKFVARTALTKVILVIAVIFVFEFIGALNPSSRLLWEEVPGVLGVTAVFTFINLDLVKFLPGKFFSRYR